MPLRHCWTQKKKKNKKICSVMSHPAWKSLPASSWGITEILITIYQYSVGWSLNFRGPTTEWSMTGTSILHCSAEPNFSAFSSCFRIRGFLQAFQYRKETSELRSKVDFLLFTWQVLSHHWEVFNYIRRRDGREGDGSRLKIDLLFIINAIIPLA